MKAYAQFPRFFIDITHSDGWDISSAFGYKRIRKLAYDEDETTLSVNAFIEFTEIEQINHLILGIGECDFNFGVFLEATGLKQSQCDVIREGELSGVLALKEAIDTGAHFLIVDAPKSKDPNSDMINSACALIGSTSSLVLENYSRENTAYSQKMRYDNGFFIPDDSVLVTIYQNISGKVLLLSNLRLARRFKKSVFEVQKENGYFGAVTPLLEALPHIQDGCEITVSDGISLVNMKLKAAEVIYRSSKSLEMPMSKYIQNSLIKDQNDPGKTAQGAYISTSSYLASKESRYRLRSDQCLDCKKIIFPPRLRCKYCGGRTKKGKFLDRHGKIYSVTNILKGAAPTEFDRQQKLDGEYLVGVIELEENVKIISQITDTTIDEIQIGDPVKMIFRKIYYQDSMTRYGYKFIKEEQKYSEQ